MSFDQGNIQNEIENSSALPDVLIAEANRLEAAKRKRYESDTKDRAWLSQWVASLVSIWLFFVLIIIMFNKDKFQLSDTVLGILLGTTTLNILGLPLVVLNGLFGSKDKITP